MSEKAQSKDDFVREMQHFMADTWGLEATFPDVEPARIDPDDKPERVTFDLSAEHRIVRDKGRWS